MESSSFCASSKRAKAPGNITQVAHCLVDGCNADLSLCRDYHRRHKVCESHSKTPKVTIGGREQRFCQQCSRFHSLVEFDEGKRSCRKRLDGHNRRRRKPQPDSLSRNSGLVFSDQHGAPSGARLISFSGPQILSSPILGSSWPHGVIKSEADVMMYNNHQQPMNYMQRHNSYDPECSSQLHFIPSVVDSDRALSLLSPAPSPGTGEFGFNQVAPHHESCPHVVQDMDYGLGHQYPFVQESKVADSHARDPSGMHMFQHGHEGPLTSGSDQTLTFLWK